MDIPSVAAMTKEMDALTQRLVGFIKENEHLRQRCSDYKDRLGDIESEKLNVIEQEAEVRQHLLNLRRKYDSLKTKYLEAQSR